jgi:hypothetical protein
MMILAGEPARSTGSKLTMYMIGSIKKSEKGTDMRYIRLDIRCIKS